MSVIGIIRNENKLLEEKANFFSDYFAFYTDQVGSFYETELENPLSLIEKILFQLETNKHNEKARYIYNYLRHDYFTDRIFLKQFSSFNPLIDQIAEYKSLKETDSIKLNKLRLKWLKNSTNFQINLKLLKTELEEFMFRKAFENILQMLTCSHKLKEHSNAIKYLSKILVTEALFKGRSKYEIKNVFLRVLSNDIKEFPFPKTVNSEEERIIYIQNRDFAKQFQGLVNFLFEEPSDYFIIVKVLGTTLPDDTIFKYNGIDFISQNSEKIKYLKESILKLESYYSEKYFSENSHLFALIPLKVFRDNILIDEIIPILQDAIIYLELILNKFLSIDRENYLYTTDFTNCGYKFNSNESIKKIDKKDIEILNDNPYEFLKEFNGEAKDHILKHEKIFIHAIHFNNLEELWQYLENLLPIKVGEIISTVSSLILLNEKYLRSKKLINFLRTNVLPWNFDYHRLNIDPGKYVSLFNEIGRSKTNNFFQSLDYPFFEELKFIKQKKHTKKRYMDLKEYYSRILLELYESRNTITHQNLIHYRAKIKLNYSVPNIIIRLRWVIFGYIRKYPHYTFQNIIQKAIEDANNLIKK